MSTPTRGPARARLLNGSFQLFLVAFCSSSSSGGREGEQQREAGVNEGPRFCLSFNIFGGKIAHVLVGKMKYYRIFDLFK